MGSGIDSPSGLDSTSSLEVALDQAIARRQGSARERDGKKRRNTPVQNFAVQDPDMSHTPTERFGTPMTALAVTNKNASLAVLPKRLCWKGIAVTDEFQEYAARVARGEELEPYRGQVLSRPSKEFPWSIAPQPSHPPQRASHPPQRPSLAPVAFGVPELPATPVYPERGRALKTALWLAAAVSSIIGALGVGAGATSSAGNERDLFAPDPSRLTQKPTATAARDEPLASGLDDAYEVDDSPIGESQLTSLAAARAKAKSAAARSASSRRSTGAGPATSSALAPTTSTSTARPNAASSAASANPASTATSGASSSLETSATAAEASADRLPIPPPSPVSSATEVRRSAGIVTTARPDANDTLPLGRDSSLFSAQTPF